MLKNIFKHNIGVCCSIIICVIAGICAGAFTVNNLSRVQISELSDYLGGFSEIYKNQSVSGGSLFTLSLGGNYKYLLFLFISGMTIIGLPAIYFLCLSKAFISGFSMGIFICGFGKKGILTCMLTLLPTDFFKLSAFMFLSINAVIFSINVFKLLARKGFDISFKNSILNFLKTSLIAVGIMLAGILYESFITPALLRILL